MTKLWRATVTYQTVIEADSASAAIRIAREHDWAKEKEPTTLSARMVQPESELARVYGELFDLAERWEDDGEARHSASLRNALNRVRGQ